MSIKEFYTSPSFRAEYLAQRALYRAEHGKPERKRVSVLDLVQQAIGLKKREQEVREFARVRRAKVVHGVTIVTQDW